MGQNVSGPPMRYSPPKGYPPKKKIQKSLALGKKTTSNFASPPNFGGFIPCIPPTGRFLTLPLSTICKTLVYG